MRRYTVHVCGIDYAGMNETKPPANARERYKLEQRLARVGRNAEASKGECMNLIWMSWVDLWLDIHEALGGEDAC